MLIAVDPGSSGGIACQMEDHTWTCSMPIGMTDIWDFFQGEDLTKARAVIEKVGGYMPGNSGPASVKFARHIGHLEMALYACGVPTEQVAPQSWMKALGVPAKLSKTERKNWIKDAMQRRYPALKVTLKTADALGILTWAMKGGIK